MRLTLSCCTIDGGVGEGVVSAVDVSGFEVSINDVDGVGAGDVTVADEGKVGVSSDGVDGVGLTFSSS